MDSVREFMGRTLTYWAIAGALALLWCPGVRAQMSDEQKKQLFLKAREDIRPVPRASASATPRPKPKPATTPESTPTPKPKPTVEDDEPTPKPKKASTPEDEETPKPKKAPTPEEEEDVKPKKSATPDDEEAKPKKSATPDDEEPKAKATPEPKASPSPDKAEPDQTPKVQIPQGKTPAGENLNTPIVIEKSGLEEDQGLEPASKSTGGWFKRWRYLSPATRKAIDSAKVKKGRWKYIIVHNSGTRQGNARAFDAYHRNVRKMVNGMAYHFVIGNGSSSGNGEIEIGSRWTKQINGGHVASDYLNNIALGICLVGDLNRDQPTKEQLAALDELIVYLRGRVGKVKGKPAIVLPHKKINPKPTDCPGDRFPYSWLQQKFGS